MTKEITNRKVGGYIVVLDSVRIGSNVYETTELMDENEIMEAGLGPAPKKEE